MDEEIKRFFLYGVNTETSKKECIKSVILLFVFLIPSVFIGGVSVVTIILCILLGILYIKSIYKKFDKDNMIRGYAIFLHNGVLAVCFTGAALIIGTRVLFLVIPDKYHIIAFLIIVFAIFLILLIYIILLNLMIKKRAYSNAKIAYCSVPIMSAGIIGITFGRIVAPKMNNQQALIVLIICCYGFASLTMLGVVNLYKYYYIENSEELIREADKILHKKK